MKQKIIIFLIITSFLTSSFIFPAKSYNDTSTHPSLTQEIAELYNTIYDPDLNAEEINLLVQASTDEDTPPRWVNHFLDPITYQGWQGERLKGISKETVQKISQKVFVTDPVSSLNWAHNQKLQAQDYARYQGNRTFERAISLFLEGKKKESYYTLGHVLHLIEDATVPAHTRQDTHFDIPLPKFIEKLINKDFDQGEPFEIWAKQLTKSTNNLQIAEKLKNNYQAICRSLDDCLKSLTKYTNNNFFSQDTILDRQYSFPKPSKYIKEESKIRYYKKLGNDEFPLAEVLLDVTGTNIIGYTLNSDVIHRAYWERLAPRAVLAGTEVINYFHQQVEKAKNKEIKIAQAPKVSLRHKIKNISFFGELAKAHKFVQAKISKITKVTWLKSHSSTDLTDSPQARSGTIASQVQAGEPPVFDAQFIEQNPTDQQTIELEPNQTATLSIKIKNSGDQTWTKNTVSLNVDRTKGQGLEFYHHTWSTQIRPTLLTQAEVKPGQEGIFNFQIAAPDESGEYQIFFHPVYHQKKFLWLGNYPSIQWLVNVKKNNDIPPLPTLAQKSIFTDKPTPSVFSAPVILKQKPQPPSLPPPSPPKEKIKKEEKKPPLIERITKPIKKLVTNLPTPPPAPIGAGAGITIPPPIYPKPIYRRLADVIPPDTFIDNQPANPTNATNATFIFHSDEDATFECQLDSENWQECVSPQKYKNLSDGEHSIQIRAQDPSGNQDETPVNYPWFIDSTTTNAFITLEDSLTGSNTLTNQKTISVSVSNDKEANAWLISETQTTQPTIDNPNWQTNRPIDFTLSDNDGLKTVYIWTKDEMENISQAGNRAGILLDTTPPDRPNITSPFTESTYLTNQSTLTLQGTKSEDTTFILINNSPEGIDYPETITWQKNITLNEGENIFTLSAQDQGGNNSQKSTVTITLDNAPPDKPSITSPFNGTTHNTNQNPITVIGSKSSDTVVILINDSSENITYSNGISWQKEITLAKGDNIFEVKAQDQVGNISEINTVTITYTPKQPPAAITDSTITNPYSTTNSIALSWTAPEDSDSETGDLVYDIRYALTEITEDSWPDATQITDEPAVAEAGANQTYTLSGLTAGTKYFVALKTSDEENISELSNALVYMTPWTGTISLATTWTKQNSPYVVSNSLVFDNSLTVEAGVIVKSTSTANITFNSSLTAQGTSNDQIVFTSIRDDENGGDTNGDGSATTPAASDWDYLKFSTDSQADFQYVLIQYGDLGMCPPWICPPPGEDYTGTGVVRIVSATVTMDHTTITNNDHGVEVHGFDSVVAITNSNISSNNVYQIWNDPDDSGNVTVDGEPWVNE